MHGIDWERKREVGGRHGLEGMRNKKSLIEKQRKEMVAVIQDMLGNRRGKRQGRKWWRKPREKHWMERWHRKRWYVKEEETGWCKRPPPHHPSFSHPFLSRSLCSDDSQRRGRGKSAPCSRSLLQMSLGCTQMNSFTSLLPEQNMQSQISWSSFIALKPDRRNTAII